MPKIEQTNRVQPVADESAYRAPKKTITQSTGMDLKQTMSGAPADPSRQPVTTEDTSPASTPDSQGKEVTLSPQLATIARKEAKLRQQEQAFKIEQEKLNAERAEIAELKAMKAKLAAKDYSALDGLIDYNEFTNYTVDKLNSSDPTQESIKKLESKLDSIEQANKDNVNKQYEATLNQYRKEIKQIVESNPEFDSIKTQKAEEHVLQLIVDTFNDEGETLSVEQAAKDIEEYIIEEALELSKLKRVQEKLKPAAEEKKLPPPKTGSSSAGSGLRTLTNQVTQANPSTTRNQFQHLSMKERIAQAVARSTKS